MTAQKSHNLDLAAIAINKWQIEELDENKVAVIDGAITIWLGKNVTMESMEMIFCCLEGYDLDCKIYVKNEQLILKTT